MAKKKKKKKSKLWSAVKWVAAIGGGAVVGEYTVRFVDRKLGVGGSSPESNGEVGGAVGAGEAYALESSSPMSNPLAMSAIAPVMPVAVPVPSISPIPVAPMPQIPAAPSMSSGHMFADEGDAAAAAPKIESAAEARARKQREFEELVQRFQEDDL